MEAQDLIVQTVDTDDHGGRSAGLLERLAPPRDSLAVGGEDDCLGRARRNVYRDLPSAIELERLGDELSRDSPRVPPGRPVGVALKIARLPVHGLHFKL